MTAKLCDDPEYQEMLNDLQTRMRSTLSESSTAAGRWLEDDGDTSFKISYVQDSPTIAVAEPLCDLNATFRHKETSSASSIKSEDGTATDPMPTTPENQAPLVPEHSFRLLSLGKRTLRFPTTRSNI